MFDNFGNNKNLKREVGELYDIGQMQSLIKNLEFDNKKLKQELADERSKNLFKWEKCEHKEDGQEQIVCKYKDFFAYVTISDGIGFGDYVKICPTAFFRSTQEAKHYVQKLLLKLGEEN